MSIINQRILKAGKKGLKYLLSFVLLVMLLLVLSWFYFRSDAPYLIQKIETLAHEKLNVDLQLEGYKLEWRESFSGMRIHLREVNLLKKNKKSALNIKANSALVELDFQSLRNGNFDTAPIILDSVWLYLYKDSLINQTIKTKKTKEEKPSDFELKSLSQLKINFLDFYNQDSYKRKWQRAQFHQPVITPNKNENRDWEINLSSACTFDGLVFKERDGGYLMGEEGDFDLNFIIDKSGDKFSLEKSSLKVDDNTFWLEGQFYRKDVNRLVLEISADNVLMKEVLPLLSKKINHSLRFIEVDGPINAKFSMDELLVPGNKGKLRVDFASENTRLKIKKVEIQNTTFRGYYKNDCEGDSSVEKGDCIMIDYFDGDILNLLPTRLTGVISNLKDPDVSALGVIDVKLPRLNSLLEGRGKFTFSEGDAHVDFQYAGNLLNFLNEPFSEQDILLHGAATFDNITLESDSRYAASPSLSGHMQFDEKQALIDDIFLQWMGSNIKISGRLGNLPEFLFYDDDALESDLSLQFDHVNIDKFNNPNPSSVSTSPEEKSQNLQTLLRKIASNVNGTIQLDIDRLDMDTFFLEDLKSQFRLYTPRRSDFLDSSMIRVDQLTAQFMGDMPFQLDLGFTRDTITELWFDVNLPDATGPAQFFLQDEITNMSGKVNMNLYAQFPLRAIFDAERLRSKIDYRGKVDFEEFELKLNSFAWDIKKVSGPFQFDKEQLLFDQLQFTYQGSPFVLNGTVDNYYSPAADYVDKAAVDLKLNGQYFDLRGRGNNTAESKKSTPSPAKLFQSLDTLFSFAEGNIELRLDSIITDQHTINPFLLKANLFADDQNPTTHQLRIDSFNLGFGPKNHIKGSAIIRDTENPFLSASFESRMKFSQLGKLLPSEYIEMKEGFFRMNFDYKSFLFDTLNAENYFLKAKIDGDAKLVNGNIFYNYRDFEFNDVYSHFSFNENDIYIRDIDLEANGNRIFGSGQAKDFFKFFILPNQQPNIEMKITAPIFDFGNFTAPQGLAKDTLITEELVENPDSLSNLIFKTASLIDQLLDRGAIEMDADIQTLKYEKIIANNLLGRISLQPDSVILDSLKMDIADGQFMINGHISEVVNHKPKIKIDVEMNQNNIRKIFSQFEDFGQKDLSYRNLKGKASAKIQFNAQTDANYAIQPETMHGDLAIKLTGGQLIDLGALKEVSGFLFKKRKLDHIILDTLQTNIHVRGSDIYIDDFFLRSSSFTFGIQGVYSLGEINNTRLLFTVPFSNLYRRHIDTAAMKDGSKMRKGLPILIDYFERKDKMRFKWKWFNFKKGRKKYQLPEHLREFKTIEN